MSRYFMCLTGYSLPLTGHLFSKRSDGKRRLTLDLGSSLEDVYVEELVVKVREAGRKGGREG
jgi:hypothetical protein